MRAHRRTRRRMIVFTGLAVIVGAVFAVASARTDAPRRTYFGRVEPPADDVFRFNNGAEPELLDPALMSGQPDGRIARMVFEGLCTPTRARSHPTPGWRCAGTSRRTACATRSTCGRRPLDRRRPAHRARLRVVVAARAASGDAARYADLLYLVRNAEAYNKGELQDPAQSARAADDSTLRRRPRAPTPYFL